jgi:hypothetical protein
MVNFKNVRQIFFLMLIYSPIRQRFLVLACIIIFIPTIIVAIVITIPKSAPRSNPAVD